MPLEVLWICVVLVAAVATLVYSVLTPEKAVPGSRRK